MTDFEKNPELEEELEVNVITLTDDETGEEQDFEIWARDVIDGQLYYVTRLRGAPRSGRVRG